jgi:hypothetical protein
MTNSASATTTQSFSDQEFLVEAALHEAGHAAVAVRLRLPFTRVQVYPKPIWEGGYLIGGQVEHPGYSWLRCRAHIPVFRERADGTFVRNSVEERVRIMERSERRYFERFLVVLFSGIAAQQAFSPSSADDDELARYNGADDIKQAVQIAKKHCGIPKTKLVPFLRRFEQRARRMMADPALLADILLIQQELLKHTAVSSRNVRERLQKSGKRKMGVIRKRCATPSLLKNDLKGIVSESALLARVNRVFRKECPYSSYRRVLRRARNAREATERGLFYIVDNLDGSWRVHQDIDKVARELGVLSKDELVVAA